MRYINTDTGVWPVSESEIRSLFPRVSFAHPFVAPAPFAEIVDSPEVECDPVLQKVVQADPVLENGVYRQQWQIVPLSDAQIADNQATARTRLIEQYEKALDDHLDSVARVHRFSDRTRLVLRAAYPNYWQALGLAFGTWMDGCNKQAQTLLQSVLSGQAQIPTVEAFISSFPAFEP